MVFLALLPLPTPFSLFLLPEFVKIPHVLVSPSRILFIVMSSYLILFFHFHINGVLEKRGDINIYALEVHTKAKSTFVFLIQIENGNC